MEYIETLLALIRVCYILICSKRPLSEAFVFSLNWDRLTEEKAFKEGPLRPNEFSVIHNSVPYTT